MPMIIKDGRRYCTSSNLAKDIIYDNETSGLEATNVQDAIDEVVNTVNDFIISFTVNYDVNLSIPANSSVICDLPRATRDSAIPSGYKLLSNAPLCYMTDDGYTGVYRSYRDDDNYKCYVHNYAQSSITLNVITVYYLAIREFV